MDTIHLNDWGFGSNKPFVIAGPCSVETPQQLDATVGQLVEKGIEVIRGGVWKPRTRPNSFEGVGEIALPWIKDVKQKFGVKFATEVATPYHVEKALEFGMELLWVGARSTVNPFTVQEIANALKGVDIPVLVKNPVNPDLALWIGALERINQAGIKKLGAIHRGFSNFNDHTYRNSPLWQIPLELKTRYPYLPLINDPSHICGKRDLIPMIAQMALDLDMDGLIIESHIYPDEAWSDAAQQVTPDALNVLLSQLHVPSPSAENPIFKSKLELIREQIDEVDRALLATLSQRMKLVEQAGIFKKENDVALFQIDRWKKVFQSRPEWAVQMDLNPDFIKELFRIIHVESIREQSKQMGSD